MPKGLPEHRKVFAIGAYSNDVLDTDPLGIAALKPVSDTQRAALALAPAAQEALIPAAWCQFIPDEGGYAARMADSQPSRPVSARIALPPIFGHGTCFLKLYSLASVDQSGNSAEAARRNAVLEGVADRVELDTGDMTALPFEDSSFDVVLSSLAIHNIKGSAGRAKAVSEAVRVLRPGGRLLIADVRGTRQYELHLCKIGMNDVARRRLGQFGWGGASALTPLVTATKPA